MTDPTAADAGTPQRLDGGVAYTGALEQLFGLARHQVAILSHALPRDIYGAQAVVDHMQTFLLGSPRAQVRVLVHQPDLAMRRAHRFVELARRLSSRVEFRQLAEEHRSTSEEYVIADEQALLYKENHDQLSAIWRPHSPLDARLKLRAYEELWNAATPAREFYALGL